MVAMLGTRYRGYERRGLEVFFSEAQFILGFERDRLLKYTPSPLIMEVENGCIWQVTTIEWRMFTSIIMGGRVTDTPSCKTFLLGSD